MPLEGVDYAFPPIPSAAALVAAGKHFACRYGGPGSDGKQLHAAERDALHAAGLGIVANAEGSADGLLAGRPAGVAWARSALDYFGDLGLPPSRPIYLSADFDCTSTQWPAVADALRGAASVLGLARVGVYGSYKVMVWARRDNVARWFWQTYAWSAGRWAPGNHIEQYRNGVMIGGADCDLNRALVADYGQWMGDDMAFMDDNDFKALAYRVEALVNGRDTVIGGPTKGEKVLAWNTIADKLADDPEFLAAVKKQVVVGDITVPSTPLGDADKPAIVDAVKQAMREGSA